MKFENVKIQPSDISANGVASAPDRLSGTAEENKAVFDRLIKNVVAGKFNSFVDLVREEIESIEVPPEGAPGYTPIKGTDYWTEEDKAEIETSVKEATLQTLREEDLEEINEALEALDANKLSMTLLWENASPKSDFAAQDITVDISGGRFVVIDYCHSSGASIYQAVYALKPNMTSSDVISGQLDAVDTWSSSGADVYRHTVRNAKIYTNKITFAQGFEITIHKNTPASGGTYSNAYCVPVRIYIIK